MSETTPFAEPNVYVKQGNAPVQWQVRKTGKKAAFPNQARTRLRYQIGILLVVVSR